MTSMLSSNRIKNNEALKLWGELSLPELGMLADSICNEKHPELIRTYVVDRNINYTNICISKCRFCAFYRDYGHPDGYVLSDEKILEKIDEAVSLGATQILMQGGLHPDLHINYFERLFAQIKDRYCVQLHSLSAPEIVHIAKISNLTVRDTLSRLKNAGLDSLPGGGAEILTDNMRASVSPGKCSAAQWIDVMRNAAELNMRATATMVFGMGETIVDRIAHLDLIRSLQDDTGVFTAFIAWPFQPGNTSLGGNASGAHDYLRTLAMSRIYLDNIDNLQASWVTQGDRIAQLALRFGANDIGSTMIEENVVAAAGVSHRMSEDALIAIIHGAGFDAAQRTTLYDIIKNHNRDEARA